ncbi:hypothetical protein J7T55_009178 [Diaporthe amygdali]|uniref:uncharacterized protein n=1 Tax=Phomopsis amygdali TaxID=1214568 RepID=UPI0022FDCA0A|nr:uncharacterized protein J7T55_009178 [Diaporthe amygdali]KAJ0118395.1 hypothetical protein J7T55_009178 [Diaporthe amygdali]
MTETASAPETGATAIADLPTGEPIPAPTPAESKTSRPPTATKTNLAALLKSLPSSADAFLAHLQRCLATPSGIDTLLLFICYTSRFTGAALTNLSQPVLHRSARDLVALAFTLPNKTAVVLETTSGAPPPASAALAQLAALLGQRLKSLGSLASEARTIARLWALVGMYFWAKRLVLNLVAARKRSSSSSSSEKGAEAAAAAAQGESSLAVLVSWAQLISCGIFQVLENGAYLSGRGVLGWTPAQQGKAYVVGARWLGVYTALELGRLLGEFVARRDQKYSEASAEEKAEVDALRRSAAINMAWAPLTVHWSMEKGFLTDLVVGAGGCIPGVIQMRKLWRETA